MVQARAQEMEHQRDSVEKQQSEKGSAHQPVHDDDDHDAPNPYVYRPRRSLRIGADYQATIPAWEGPPGPDSESTKEEERQTAPTTMMIIVGLRELIKISNYMEEGVLESIEHWYRLKWPLFHF